MTTIQEVELTCAVCGETNTFVVTPSSNSYDQDLDGRPVGMARHSGYGQPLRCPACGYSVPDLEFDVPGVAQLVHSESYQAILGDATLPERAQTCLAAAEVAGLIDARIDQMRFQLMASWDCDDADDDMAASRCRRIALETTDALAARDDIAPEDRIYLGVIRSDLLRRVGEFDQATDLCRQTLAIPELEDGSAEQRILHFELLLISSCDRDAHACGEVDPDFMAPSIML